MITTGSTQMTFLGILRFFRPSYHIFSFLSFPFTWMSFTPFTPIYISSNQWVVILFHFNFVPSHSIILHSIVFAFAFAPCYIIFITDHNTQPQPKHKPQQLHKSELLALAERSNCRPIRLNLTAKEFHGLVFVTFSIREG
jgi:hypothetical protein